MLSSQSLLRMRGTVDSLFTIEVSRVGRSIPMSRSAHVPLFATALLCSIISAQAQELPAGPGKETVAAACSGCHEVNRIRGGYTPEGWRSVIQMMKNVDAPVPQDQWE